MSSVRGARPARQHCCQGKRAEGASEPHQRPPLRMQVSGRSCNGEEGHPSPAQTGPAGPTAALLSPGTALGGQERTHQFLGSSSPRTRRTKEGGHEITGKHTCSLYSQTPNAGADGNKLSPPPHTRVVSCLTPKSLWCPTQDGFCEPRPKPVMGWANLGTRFGSEKTKLGLGLEWGK